MATASVRLCSWRRSVASLDERDVRLARSSPKRGAFVQGVGYCPPLSALSVTSLLKSRRRPRATSPRSAASARSCSRFVEYRLRGVS
eukprot:1852880-Prymnesium_polylepis.3